MDNAVPTLIFISSYFIVGVLLLLAAYCYVKGRYRIALICNGLFVLFIFAAICFGS